MAISFTAIGQAPRVDHQTHGMQMHHVKMVTSTGGGGADYSSGFDIQGSAAKLGFRQVFAVISAAGYAAAGTFLPLLFWNYDSVTGKLRVANATSEANAAATLDAGASVRLVVIGV